MPDFPPSHWAPSFFYIPNPLYVPLLLCVNILCFSRFSEGPVQLVDQREPPEAKKASSAEDRFLARVSTDRRQTTFCELLSWGLIEQRSFRGPCH